MHTEETNPASGNIDTLSLTDIIRIMDEENQCVVDAVKSAGDSIERIISDVLRTIKSGGSLIYIGAGTSGRLGVLDASEMPPTFGVSSDIVKGIIAGGEKALTEAVEGAEDDETAGIRAVAGIRSVDLLIGISASGKTRFTISALIEGKRRGAVCWLMECNDAEYDFLDGIIKLPVGPEIVAGSTRLKAGTATKMVLNMISTAAMIKLGKVYKGYMIDVIPSNIKLKNRAKRMIQEITGCGMEEAEELLVKSGGNAKTAVLMYMKKLSQEEAVSLLESSEGSLRNALENGR